VRATGGPALRGKPVIVVQTLTDSAVAIAASYPAKAFGIKTGMLVREARRLCPAVVTVQTNHRLHSDYHERILKVVDTCLPVQKVCSIDEMACRWPRRSSSRSSSSSTRFESKGESG
jgi:DNA polymerase-4